MNGGADAALSRALTRLSGPHAVLAPVAGGAGFGVYPAGDRRRRPAARLSAAEVRALAAEGAIVSRGEDGGFILTDAGRARARRAEAAPGRAYLAQHGDVIPRTLISADGEERAVEGVDGHAALKRLSQLRAADGRPWLAPAELAAAQRLRADWEAGQMGLAPGADWSAPPRGGAARGAGNAREALMAAGCDARRRMSEALEALAPPLRRVVERVCLYEDGLEALERGAGWPPRSGKLALKLGLAQLAAGPPRKR